MLRDNLINQIDRILVKDNMKRRELSLDHQNMEINDTTDLSDCSTSLLKVLLKRAKAQDKVFSDKTVQLITGANSSAENHDLIYETADRPDLVKTANDHSMSQLINVLKRYHTSLVGVNVETGDWDRDPSGNDGYTVAPKSYLVKYYQGSGLDQDVLNVNTPYVTASAQRFYKPEMYDINNELQGLVNFVSDNANNVKTNNKYYHSVTTGAANF